MKTVCPNCHAPMQEQALERRDDGTVPIEMCLTCAGIWFDHWASIQLAPAAVVELFKQIDSHAREQHRALAKELPCPRCGRALLWSSDLGKSGRFSYYRCPQNHGRFTPFLQFLREKQFVRTLTPAELRHVRAQVSQLRCSDCGAPIDLERDTQCNYCHAPVSFLDPDAVEKAIRMWSQAEDRRRRPQPQAIEDTLHRIRLAGQARLGDGILMAKPGAGTSGAVTDIGSGVDLISLGVGLLADLFLAD
jgi:hypothetical protein